MRTDAETYLKRWTDNNERLDYVLSRAGDRISNFTKLPDGEFIDVVNEAIENLQYIRLLHACEHNRIPNTDEFYHLKIATEECHKINMIKYLRAMFHTTLDEAYQEIKRVFGDSYSPIRKDPFPIHAMFLERVQVEKWGIYGCNPWILCTQ